MFCAPLAETILRESIPTMFMYLLQSGVQQMNDTIHSSRSISVLGWNFSAVLILLLGSSLSPAQAQAPPGMTPVYGAQPYGAYSAGPPPQYQLPERPQYYEYLPDNRFGGDYVESPIDRLLKQTLRQTYGRMEYLNWSISNPGDSVIGGPGKRLTENYGFNTPAYIDPVRGPNPDINPEFLDSYPIRNPLLTNHNRDKVLIQAWETNGWTRTDQSRPNQLLDDDGDGNVYDLTDIYNNATGELVAGGDGFYDDTNDIDIFPRISNAAKSSMLAGTDTDIIFSSGGINATDTDPDAAQVAVLAVGQLANTGDFNLNSNNGFRGLVGLDTSFGALETNFFVIEKARSHFEYIPIQPGFIGVPGGDGTAGGSSRDPQVIPILVNDQIAPNVYDQDGILVTDSNNYYIIFNDAYNVTFESQAWGFAPNIYWTLYDRPDRLRFSSSLGFRYFDFREGMYQWGRYTTSENDADFAYDDELVEPGDYTEEYIDSEGETAYRLDSTINSNTINRVYGPQAGFRAELGDDRIKFGFENNLMLGANTSEATVMVDDLLYVGDDNFTKQNSTNFSLGYEMLVDARLRITNHMTLTVGYNFMYFNNITRPHDNIYYNVDATAVPIADHTGEDYTYENDVIVDKKKTSVNLSGVSVGVLIDW